MGPNLIKVGGVLITGYYDSWKLVDNIYFIPRSAIPEDKMKYYKESDKTTTHDKYGTAKYYDIVVEGKTVKDGAWYYNGEKTGELKDSVGFRVTRRGDPGNPHYPLYAEPEGDGVTVEEDWFG